MSYDIIRFSIRVKILLMFYFWGSVILIICSIVEVFFKEEGGVNQTWHTYEEGRERYRRKYRGR